MAIAPQLLSQKGPATPASTPLGLSALQGLTVQGDRGEREVTIAWIGQVLQMSESGRGRADLSRTRI